MIQKHLLRVTDKPRGSVPNEQLQLLPLSQGELSLQHTQQQRNKQQAINAPLHNSVQALGHR